MATKKVGDLIKEARTHAGLSQAALAELIDGVSSSDIGKAERGEKELTQAALKAIAKATGVTQKSLLEAPKGASTSAKKTTSASASTKKTTSSSASAKKTTSSSASTKKTTDEITLSSTEKTLVKLYRAADSDTKKAALSLLKGETTATGNLLDSLLGGAMDALLGKK